MMLITNCQQKVNKNSSIVKKVKVVVKHDHSPKTKQDGEQNKEK